MLPATESLLVVGLLDARKHSFKPLLCRDIAPVPSKNGLVDSLLFSVVHSDVDFFKSIFVLLVLFHSAHGVSVSVPGHSKPSCPELL